MINKINEWQGTATLSISQEHSQWLWQTLKYSVPSNNWRAVIDSKGWIASIHVITDKNNKLVTQQIYSNAFIGQIQKDINYENEDIVESKI